MCQLAGVVFIWLFALLIFNKAGRILLIACTFPFVLFSFWIEPRLIEGESAAAARARSAYSVLQEYSADHPGKGYPATINEVPSLPFPSRFYQLKYVALRRTPEGLFTGFVLTITPVRYDCGLRKSFAVSADGVIHYTDRNREATLSDPEL